MKALVIGAARSGVGATHLLLSRGYSVTLVANSDFKQRLELEERGATVVLDDSATDKYDDVDLVVKNPGIPNSHPLVSRFNEVVNEIEVAASFNPQARLYGISGTNGKTTTTSLLYKMLESKDASAILAGNVGFSYCEIVYQTGDVSRDVALELSSFQMENLPHLRLKAYALLNLTPDHLDRYESVEAYYMTKTKLANQAEVVLYNIDDENVVEYTQHISVPKVSISLETDADVYVKDSICYFQGNPLFHIKYLKLAGKHNLMNTMFAAALAHLAGVKKEDIEHTLSIFAGVEHRLEYVNTVNGAKYYNDSKATNPESTEVALKAFEDNQVILLAGGYDKHIPFTVLKQYESKIKHMFVYGDSAQALKDVFPQAVVVDTMREAFSHAYKLAKENDVVLLSPACASFDQFTDYEERGRIFKEYVQEIAK